MSERKVLNKYYPPDFDPSKIPRSKEPRNKTFIIRVMAPCNMRCTTCGEYIYKGRKFNARKEDVDDMDHLGLRIYRFYIKCTACISEIVFRTDPANTDYVLEAGATRNFEALAKAEKQAEMEERARKEELESNPMKLLEERTEQSRNEMDRMEALEELQELNKREVKIDYDNLLSKYDRLRELEAAKQEAEDEAFINKVFRKDGDVGKVKRILDDEDEDDSDEEAKKTIIKRPKVENATDLLAEPEKEKKKEAWEKSVGSLGSLSKKGLGIVVKKKQPAASQQQQPSTSKLPEPAKDKAQPSGLGLLGAYSDSDDSS